MLSNYLRAGAIATFLITGTAAIAAEQVTPTATTTSASSEYRAKQILGAKIMIQGNTAIGTVAISCSTTPATSNTWSWTTAAS